MEQQKRGSDILQEAYRARGFTVTEELVGQFAQAVGEIGVHDVFVKGLVEPDYLRSTFTPDGAAGAVELTRRILEVIEAGQVPAHVRVFPRGIPWPGEFLVELTIARGQA
jgi:hypothetical protein